LPELSKRAVRRLIQRAFVLAGRNRKVRDHLRHANLVTLWIIEDWGLRWTVSVARGKVGFERRPAKRPDATLHWLTAEQFFLEIASNLPGVTTLEETSARAHRRFIQPLYHAFRSSLVDLMRNPMDEDGEPLL
jgi:hypothetical protein